MRAPTRARALRRVALVLGIGLLALVVAEVGLRLSGMQSPYRPGPTENKIHRPVPLPLGWELIPGASERRHGYTDDSGVEREIVASINEHGWRGPSVAKEKPAGSLRLVCLGDSFTFGDGVQDDETWPAQLGLELASTLGPDQVQVLNWGVSGYDTAREIGLLEKRLAEFEPDIVVLGYFVNDIVFDPPVDRFTSFLLLLAGARPIAPVRWLRSVSWVAELSSQALARWIWARRARVSDPLQLGYEESTPGWAAEVSD